MAKVILKDTRKQFSLTVDGVEIPGVTSYSLIRTDYKETAVLLISVDAVDIETEVDAEVDKK